MCKASAPHVSEGRATVDYPAVDAHRTGAAWWLATLARTRGDARPDRVEPFRRAPPLAAVTPSPYPRCRW